MSKRLNYGRILASKSRRLIHGASSSRFLIPFLTRQLFNGYTCLNNASPIWKILSDRVNSLTMWRHVGGVDGWRVPKVCPHFIDHNMISLSLQPALPARYGGSSGRPILRTKHQVVYYFPKVTNTREKCWNKEKVRHEHETIVLTRAESKFKILCRIYTLLYGAKIYIAWILLMTAPPSSGTSRPSPARTNTAGSVSNEAEQSF